MRQAGPRSFSKNLPFELREDGEQAGHGASGWRGQVQRFGQRHEPNAEMLQFLQAVNLLAKAEGRLAYNVILDIEDPLALPPSDTRIVEALDRFLVSHDTQPVSTVAGTISPAGHYRQRGAKGVLEDFPEKVYPKIKKSWGTYSVGQVRTPALRGIVDGIGSK
jgi:hypothetical protein